jgi:hypothetical protein
MASSDPQLFDSLSREELINLLKKKGENYVKTKMFIA